MTSVSPGICTVQVAGGEIPVIYFKGATPSVGDFVSVQRQSVVSYLMTAPLAGAVWVSGFGGVAKVILASGASTVISLPGSDNGPQGLVKGPDGNMWVCDNFNGGVWRVTAGGDSVFYPLSNAGNGSVPEDIVVGPNNNLWLADNNAQPGAWQVTTSGVGTFYPAPSQTMVASGICEGSDGNLWLTDQANGGLWRMTPTGSYTFFQFSAPAAPLSVVAGPDGRLWAGDNSTPPGAEHVWAMTVTGTSTPYSVPVYGGPWAVSNGPGKLIWFCGYGYVGSVTTGGALTTYPVGTSTTELQGICEGPDGNLWASQFNNGDVWKVLPSGDATAYPTGMSAAYDIAPGPA